MADNKINTRHMTWLELWLERGPRMVPPGCEPAGPGAISAWVAGVPAPQGSKRPLGRRGGFGKVIMVESSTKVKPWRADVRQAFRDRPHGASVLTSFPKGTPVVVKIVFVLARTKAMRDRPAADFPMTQMPDLDKLVRSTLDGIKSVGNVYVDDSQVVAVHAYKRRAEPGEPTGAMIHIERTTQDISGHDAGHHVGS